MHKSSLLVPLTLILALSCVDHAFTIHPAVENITESVYASGIIRSKDQYEVFSTVNGLLEEKLVSEGELVRRNQPIIRLSNLAARLNERQARVAVEHLSLPANKVKLKQLETVIYQEKIRAENAKLMLERQQNLWNQQIGTHNELEQRELAYETSRLALEKANLNYQELQKEIHFQARQSETNLKISESASGDFVLKSNIDGKVYSIFKEKGEMVNTQTPLAMVGSAEHFIIELRVDEYDVAKIRTGQKVIIGMDSYKSQVYKATIRKIRPFMNERSKTFIVEADFVETPPLLYPNLTCEANILIREKHGALTIPTSCLREGDLVMLQNKKIIKVKTGLKNFQKVEILEGLTNNDLLSKADQ